MSQFSHPVYGPGGFASRYMHSLSPHDSVRHLSLSSRSRSSGNSSVSSRGLLSPKAHEDVHSHISLSFYTESGFFDQISSDPRTYYIEDAASCDSDHPAEDHVGKSASCVSLDGVGDGEDELASSASTWSLNHFHPPSFHTPSSVLYPLAPPFLTLTLSNDTLCGQSWGYDVVDTPFPPTRASTESDEVTDTCLQSHGGHMTSPRPPTRGGEASDESCDSHVTETTPVPPPLLVEQNGEGSHSTVVLSSDLVLPSIHTSLPPPPPSSAPPPLPLKPTNPLNQKKSMGVVESQASMSSSEDSRVFSHDRGHDHRREFEAGCIDVRGRDSSSHMLAYIDSQLKEDTSDTN